MSKYFGNSSRKGELYDLRTELNSPKEEKQCEAVKKVFFPFSFVIS